ncbi:uncharacterized protein [Oscarella lobularis]|uniref:uncharacterized protein n=1 Tax=Oscarella lobularis TaxID=121494 RepID=UPI003313F976
MEEEELFDGVREGNIDEVKRILSSSPSIRLQKRKNRLKIDSFDEKFVLGDWSPICLAAFKRNLEIVKLLMTCRFYKIWWKLTLRIIYSASQVFSSFYVGPELFYYNQTVLSLMDVACALGDEELVDDILHLNFMARGYELFSPLCWCLANRHERIARKLVRKRAARIRPTPKNIRDDDLRLCFRAACLGGMKMIELYFDIFGELIIGRFWLCPEGISFAAFGVHRDVIQFLIKFEFEQNFSMLEYGRTVLPYLCSSNRKTEAERICLLKYILQTAEGHIFLDGKNEHHVIPPPLYLAFLHTNMELAKVLVDMKAQTKFDGESAKFVVAKAWICNMFVLHVKWRS